MEIGNVRGSEPVAVQPRDKVEQTPPEKPEQELQQKAENIEKDPGTEDAVQVSISPEAQEAASGVTQV